MKTMRHARYASLLFLSLFATYCAGQKQDSSMDVDLATATLLVAQPAPTPASAVPQKGGGSGGGNNHPTGPAGPSDPELIPNLFSLAPGKFVAMASMGTIDPVGTSLSNDYDGDGINNADETTSNIWVADYPVVESTIATPVTMRIEILKDSTSSSSEIVSEITAEDMEDRKTEGTEKIHRKEINEKTVQYQDSYSTAAGFEHSAPTLNPAFQKIFGGGKSSGSPFNLGSLSLGKAFGIFSGGSQEGGPLLREGVSGLGSENTAMLDPATGLAIGSAAAGALTGLVNAAESKHPETWSANNQNSATTTFWKDVPFKNNLDRESKSVKADKATTKSQNYRSEKVSKTDENSIIKPDAGVVRAALYIKNRSVNMPVKLTNILASFMFETPDGELIPMQSFRLRNEDFSLFEVEVYGGTEFGPYVVELRDLNTVEVENAILKGYTPKIFLVDYQMSHVADSNYRSMLLNFSGENLKIIEENAKGRTSLVRMFGPNLREMFRVTAFDTDNADPCDGAATMVSPGVSLQKALERIGCGGVAVKFKDYVVDLSASGLDIKEDRVFITGIESIGGIKNDFPCTDQTLVGTDGVSRTACVMDPLSTWTEEQVEDSAFWAVFSDGKYFANSGYVLDGASQKISFSTTENIPVLKGVSSTIWVGDVYDLTYVRAADFLRPEFGTTPLVTEEPFNITTRWSKNALGEYPFDPEVGVSLGQAGLGEEIQLRFSLVETHLLNPAFNLEEGSTSVYNQFSYDPGLSTRRYNLEDAIDFELSLGLGGERTDWLNIVRDLGLESDDAALAPCGESIDYVKQVFTLCLRLPKVHPLVTGENKLVSLYLRPALNNLYRETIWPTPYSEVRQFQALILNPALTGSTTVKVIGAIGNISGGDEIHIENEPSPLLVSTVSVSGDEYTLTLSSPVTVDHLASELVYVEGSLTEPQYGFLYDGTQFSDWNAAVDPSWASNTNTQQNVPLATVNDDSCSTFQAIKCLGYVAEFLVGNWVGNNTFSNPYWNDWADASHFNEFVSGAQRKWLLTKGEILELELWDAGQFVATGGRQTSVHASAAIPQREETLTVYNNLTPPSTSSGVYARVIENETHSFVGSEIALSSDGSPVELGAVVNNDTALVVWRSGTAVKGRYIDLSTATPDGAEFVIASGTVEKVGIVQSGDLALVTFLNAPNAMGQVIDLSTKTLQGSAVQFNDSGLAAGDLSSTVNGNQAVVSYAWFPSLGNPWVIRARVFNLATGLMETSELAIASSGGNDIDVSVHGNRAVIASRSLANTLDVVVLDPSTGSILSSHNLGGVGFSPHVIVESGKAFVFWGDGTASMKGRFLDLSGVGVLKSEFVLYPSSTNALAGDISLHEGILLLTWAAPSNSRVFGRFMDWDTEMAIGSIREIGTSSALLQSPRIASSNGLALVSWIESTLPVSSNFGRIIPFPADPDAEPQYGLNNFFVAPLMERTYTIKAEIKD